MADHHAPLLKSIALENFLSFGPTSGEVPLTPLNVIIGPNGAGKSNLIEALAVLRAVPRDLPLPVRRGGGVQEWLFKGDRAAGDRVADGATPGTTARSSAARIELVLSEGQLASFQSGDPAIRYRLVFGAQGGSFVVLDERLENTAPRGSEARPYFYFGYESGRPMLNVKEGKRELRREDVDPTQSILSQRRDPEAYPELTRLAVILARVWIQHLPPLSAAGTLGPLGLQGRRTVQLWEHHDEK